MLIDNIKIKVSAGSGGNGAVAFMKKGKGPTGGNGGRGGNIYIRGVSDLGALQQFRFKKEVEAENGENGRSKLRDGHTGKDIYLRIPIGTIVYNINKGTKEEIIKEGQSFLVAKGGNGGKGNFLLRSPRNVTPKEAKAGWPGESFDLKLELKFIANIGLIGLPNAGKSSLLNELTRAKSRVANYPFTTLEPHLGVCYGIILADIPGLIEGASKGKGLGVKFLRHIERTEILFHLISSESKSPIKDYRIIRKELERYNKKLLDKKEYIFITKSDLIKSSDLEKRLNKFKKISKNVFSVSVYDFDSIEKVKKIINRLK